MKIRRKAWALALGLALCAPLALAADATEGAPVRERLKEWISELPGCGSLRIEGVIEMRDGEIELVAHKGSRDELTVAFPEPMEPRMLAWVDRYVRAEGKLARRTSVFHGKWAAGVELKEIVPDPLRMSARPSVLPLGPSEKCTAP